MVGDIYGGALWRINGRQLIWSITVTDIHISWLCLQATWNKCEAGVVAGLEHVEEQLPSSWMDIETRKLIRNGHRLQEYVLFLVPFAIGLCRAHLIPESISTKGLAIRKPHIHKSLWGLKMVAGVGFASALPPGLVPAGATFVAVSPPAPGRRNEPTSPVQLLPPLP
jgi:hypothetical protein